MTSTRAELQTLSTEFAKYKARAHTALKKATSSGADDKRKDEVGVRGHGLGVGTAAVNSVHSSDRLDRSDRSRSRSSRDSA